MIKEFNLTEPFSHNGYDYKVECSTEKTILSAAIIEINKKPKGPLVYKFLIMADGLAGLPFMPKGIYDDSIVEALKTFLIQQGEIKTVQYSLSSRIEK